MFNIPNSDEILQSLQLQSKSPMSKFEGTFEYDVFSSNAIEFMKTYVELGELYKVAFGDTSYSDFLTMRAKESGVVRKAATHAIGVVTVKGNGIVPKGSQFSTASGILFESTSEHVVKGTQQIEVRAVEPGTSGNVNANTITTISMSIPGIISVNNVEATSDGFEEETDDMLRERYLLHVRYPGTSGNTMHYHEWAMSIPGVGGAKIVPVWAGPGTVKVIIVNSEFKPASEKLVKAVKDYIESVRPTTAMVTVSSAVIKPINVSATIDGRDFNLAKFKELMQAYLIELEKMVITRDEKVKLSIAKIGSLILDAGAVDYQNLRINNSDKSIVINVDDLPILGAVNIQ
jgi:uncharacterized phage protein gp47/JayE